MMMPMKKMLLLGFLYISLIFFDSVLNPSTTSYDRTMKQKPMFIAVAWACIAKSCLEFGEHSNCVLFFRSSPIKNTLYRFVRDIDSKVPNESLSKYISTWVYVWLRSKEKSYMC